eukprot:scaffold70103_cov15-Tisochrysis_lutea.AAC.1
MRKKISARDCARDPSIRHVIIGLICLKRKEKNYACQVWPRALKKGHLKGRAPPHRPRGRGGTEVYTSKYVSFICLQEVSVVQPHAHSVSFNAPALWLAALDSLTIFLAAQCLFKCLC